MAALAGEAAGLLAWLAFDLGDERGRERLYDIALSLTNEAEDPQLDAYVRGFRSQVWQLDGRPHAALAIASQAIATAGPGRAGSVYAWLKTRQAVALAEVKEGAESMAAIAAAEAALACGTGDEPAWMYEFDYVRLTAVRADCLLRLGRPTEAEWAYQHALVEGGQKGGRFQVELLTGLATAAARQSRVEEACGLGMQSLAWQPPIRSWGSAESGSYVGSWTAGTTPSRWPRWTAASQSRNTVMSKALTAEQATAARRAVDAVSIRNGYVYWLEKRPEIGRTALVRLLLVGGDRPETMTPDELDVGSRVHEYGGGAYWVAEDDAMFVVDDTDQRIYRLTGDEPQPLTPSSGSPATVRYADLRTLPGGLLICVRERHELDGQVVNELVTLPVDTSGPAVVVASGRDFYSFPRPNPSGTHIAFTCWDHPQMPWDGSELWLAELGSDSTLTGAHRVAGGPEESLFQPEWSPDGQLYVMSDRTGWWNLYRVRDDQLEPAYVVDAECGEPQWEFGSRPTPS